MVVVDVVHPSAEASDMGHPHPRAQEVPLSSPCTAVIFVRTGLIGQAKNIELTANVAQLMEVRKMIFVLLRFCRQLQSCQALIQAEAREKEAQPRRMGFVSCCFGTKYIHHGHPSQG